MKAWYIFKLFFSVIRTARNPANTSSVLGVANSLYKLGLLEAETIKVKESLEGRKIIARKKPFDPIDLKSLNQLPQGTLGKVFSDHMLRENLAPDFYDVIDIKDDTTFVMMRLREVHDLWHTITGFGTSLPDEVGLLAFMMAQVHSPFSPILVGAALIKAALTNPKESLLMMDRITRGWQMGMQAKPLFDLEWQEHWQTPLSLLRTEYLVKPVNFSECG